MNSLPGQLTSPKMGSFSNPMYKIVFEESLWWTGQVYSISHLQVMSPSLSWKIEPSFRLNCSCAPFHLLWLLVLLLISIVITIIYSHKRLWNSILRSKQNLPCMPSWPFQLQHSAWDPLHQSPSTLITLWRASSVPPFLQLLCSWPFVSLQPTN